jgi:Zn-dependent peptidase ImmA (M78 family)/DNA-binding XRE family transcriptional regulator
MPVNERIDPVTLGSRLMAARKVRGVTQEEAAKVLGCSRPTLIAIEKGERPAKAAEIVALAAHYGRSVHDLVRVGEPVADMRPHLRAMADRMKSAGDDLDDSLSALQRFAENYAELERLMETPLRTNYPPEVALGPRIDPRILAEDVAARERDRLGLGDLPILNLREVLEWEVGLRIAYVSMPTAVEGMFTFIEGLGCFILVNRKHRPEKCRATIAHEYGHLIVDRYKPGIDVAQPTERRPPNERFAESFSMALLMPATGVRRRFHEIIEATGDFQVADLCRLAHYYYASVQAMTLRLEGLELIPGGSWDYLQGSQLKVSKAKQELGLEPHPIENEPFPERYRFLAVHAWDQERITETQLAEFLQCDRREARDIASRYLTMPALDSDEPRGLVQLEFRRSLLTRAS